MPPKDTPRKRTGPGRFQQEGRVLARLHHANIVSIFDLGTAGPFAYLLMEFVDGGNLRQATLTALPAPLEAIRMAREICLGLEFAHEQGVLHRDIKPANILIDLRGRVKIADFGIAKLLGQAPSALTGLAVGTPQYMAPEQFDAPESVDARADVYALGVALYEMLTGELPRCALKHFLAERRRNEARLKRGGGVMMESIDAAGEDASAGMQIADPAADPSDALFDREWAQAVMERSLERTRGEFERGAKINAFDILKPWLVGDTENLRQAEAAAALAVTPGAVKLMIHRLRKSFRDAIHAEISHTVPGAEDIAEEVRYLMEALG
jgi:serine/threonine protein kinase